MKHYVIYTHKGNPASSVSTKLAHRLMTEYRGEFKTHIGRQVFMFDQSASFGNNDIGITFNPGYFILLEEKDV